MNEPGHPRATTRQQTAVRILKRILFSESKLDELTLVQVSNAHGDDAAVPGLPPLMDDATGQPREQDGRLLYATYAEERERHGAAVAGLWAHAEAQDMRELIEKMIEARQKRADAELDAGVVPAIEGDEHGE